MGLGLGPVPVGVIGACVRVSIAVRLRLNTVRRMSLRRDAKPETLKPETGFPLALTHTKTAWLAILDDNNRLRSNRH